MKVFILGGSRYESIGKYLSDKGVEVNNSVENLSEELLTKVIDIDKLVIVDSDFDIIQSMSIFSKLLEYEFFNTKEIVFIGSDSRNTNEFFKMSIDKMNRPFEVRVYSEKVISLPLIYMYIFNMAKSSEVKSNEYINVYREPYESKVMVTEEDFDADEIITRKDYESINKYENLKKQLIYGKDTIIYDMQSEPKVDIVNVDDEESFIDTSEPDKKLNNVVGVTGERKSGKSVFICGLLSSLIKLNKNVLIIDAQENGSTLSMITDYYDTKNLNIKDCKDDFGKFIKFFKDDSNYVSVVNLNTDEVDVDIVLNTFNILKVYYTKFDVVIIDLPIYNKKYSNILRSVGKLFITTSLRQLDIDSLYRLIQESDIKEKINFVTTAVFTEVLNVRYYTEREVVDKFQFLNNEFMVTSMFRFKGLDVSEKFSLKLLGGILKDDSVNK